MAEKQDNGEQEPQETEELSRPYTLQPDHGSSFSTFYANFAWVTHTADDVCIDFCLVAPPYRVNAPEHVLSIPVIARVVASPGLASGLIQALQEQLVKQEQEREARHIILPLKPQEPDSDV